jgi:hypothetical protein
MKYLDPVIILMSYEYNLSSLLAAMESKRAYITSQACIEVTERLNDATVKLYQALSDIEAARKV